MAFVVSKPCKLAVRGGGGLEREGIDACWMAGGSLRWPPYFLRYKMPYQLGPLPGPMYHPCRAQSAATPPPPLLGSVGPNLSHNKARVQAVGWPPLGSRK